MTHILADLDADYCSVKWGGFTSGKAYLSIYSDMYVNSTFGFEIYEIFDEDLSEEYCYVGNSDDHAVLDEDPVLPVYLVNGTSFSLPTVTGTTYVNGEEVGTGIVANSWYRFDDGELHSYNGDPIVVSASEKVTLYYSIDGGVTKCYVIPVIPTSISFR